MWIMPMVRATVRCVSPSALLEIEERTQELIPLDRVRTVVAGIIALDVSEWDDNDFGSLEAVIDRLIALLSTPPIAPEHRPLIETLLEARAGVEQGVAPDPAKRPTSDEMRAFVSAHIS